jgi:hypothetical protein
VTFYRWMMERGAGILFIASLIMFAISFVGSFKMPGGFGPFPGETEPPSERLMFLLSAAAAFGTAISKSALTFFGACFLYRFDTRWARGAGK